MHASFCWLERMKCTEREMSSSPDRTQDSSSFNGAEENAPNGTSLVVDLSKVTTSTISSHNGQQQDEVPASQMKPPTPSVSNLVRNPKFEKVSSLG